MRTEYYKAYNLEDALSKLNEDYENPKLIAGGTDLVIELKNRWISPDLIIDISDVKELRDSDLSGDIIELGSMKTFTEIENMNLNKNMQSLNRAAKSVGSPQIRNRGTVGGNICNGSPAADMVPPLLALDSIAVIESEDGKREMKLEDVFLDKGKTVLKKNEILSKIKFAKLKDNEYLSFSKLGLRNALAISRICTSVYVKMDGKKICDIRIANGALGKYGIREKNAENQLRGKLLNEDLIREAMEIMSREVDERLQGRFSAEYKVEAIKGTINKALYEALNYFLEESWCEN